MIPFHKRHALPVLVLFSGVILSASLFLLTHAREQKRLRAHFELLARDRTMALQHEIEDNLEVVWSLASYQTASRRINRQDPFPEVHGFDLFVEDFLVDYPNIEALALISRVPRPAQPLFIQDARREIDPGFRIKEQNTQGAPNRARQRQEYYPIYAVEPAERRTALLGLDASSNPVFWEAMETALKSGQPSVTPRIVLHPDSGGCGFAAFIPVFPNLGTRSNEALRPKEPDGFAAAFMCVGEMIEIALRALSPAGIDLAIFDETAPPEERFLYFHPSRLTKGGGAGRPTDLSEFEHRRGIQWSTKIEVGARSWLVVAKPTPSFLSSQGQWYPWALLAGGLLITALAGVYLGSAMQSTIRTEQLVAKRTVELSREISERKRAEEALSREKSYFQQLFESSPLAALMVDDQDRIIQVNRGFESLFQYTREESLSAPINSVIVPETLLEEASLYSRQVLSGKVVQAETVRRRKDGSPVDVALTGYPVLSDGKVAGVYVMYQDISARKRAEEAVQRTHDVQTAFNALLRQSLRNIPLDEILRNALDVILSVHWLSKRATGAVFLVGDTGDVLVLRAHRGMSKEVREACSRVPYGRCLCGLVASSRELQFADHITEAHTTCFESTKPHGHYVVPIVFRESLLGVVNVYLEEGHTRDAGEEEFLNAFADVLANIIERKRAEEALQEAHGKLNVRVKELQQRSHEITLLGEMGDALQACMSCDEAHTVVARYANRIFPSHPGAVYLIAPSRNLVEPVVTWGCLPFQQRVFNPDDCWALRRGRLHVVEDVNTGLICRHVEGATISPRPYLCVPMMAQGEALGLLYLEAQGDQHPTVDSESVSLDEAVRHLAITMSEHVGLALANMRLRETLRQQSIRDPLTGLFNRRYMEESLERELHRARRNKASLGIIMLDIDDFKPYNDTHGHEAGDAVLQTMGRFLQNTVRGEDVCCRYGGEEFTIILPEASLEDTRRRAEELRQGSQVLQATHGGRLLGTITISLGVAIFPDHGSTAEQVLKAADAALYRAKREGRDRVVVA